jgi:hypothetical protein
VPGPYGGQECRLYSLISSGVVSMLSRRHRQYIGLAVVILTYLGGIVGWSWAVYTLDSPADSASDTTAVLQEVRSDTRYADATRP